MINAYGARKEARESLNGKWKTAILIALIYSLILFGIGFISSLLGGFGFIITIANIVIAPPLTYGITYVYYHMKNGESVQYTDFLTVGFKNFGRSWKIAWAIFCKCWYFIVIPIALIIILSVSAISMGLLTFNSVTSIMSQKYGISSYYDDYDYYDYYDYYDSDYYDDRESSIQNGGLTISDEDVKNLSSVVASSLIILLVVGIVLIVYIVFCIFAIRKFLLYALSFYIAVGNENIIPKDAVQESENLMKGNRGRLFSLILSFIGWAFLIGIVDGILVLTPFVGAILSTAASVIGTAVLMPYVRFAILAFYRDLKMSQLNNNQYAYANNMNMGQMNYNGQNINNNNNGYQVNNNPNMYNQNTNNMGNISYRTNNMNNQNNNSQISNPVQNVNMPNINENKVDNNIQNIDNNENQMPKKYCKKCGKENIKDAMFCTNCGEKLD